MRSNALKRTQLRSNALTWPMRKAFSFAPPLISHICLRSLFMRKNESLYSHSRSSQKRSQWPFFLCSSLWDVEAKIIWWQKKPFQLSAKENALQFIIMHSCNVYFGLKRERGGWFICFFAVGISTAAAHWLITTVTSVTICYMWRTSATNNKGTVLTPIRWFICFFCSGDFHHCCSLAHSSY